MSKQPDNAVQIFESFKSIYNKISNKSFESEDMTLFLQNYVYIYTKYIGSINVQNLVENYLQKTSKNDSNHKLTFFDKTNNFIYNGKLFYIYLLMDYLLSNLIGNRLFKEKFIELTKDYFTINDKFYYMRDVSQLSDTYCNFKVCFNNEMLFYFIKEFTDCSTEQFDREKKIMLSNYSKFIVSIAKESEEKSESKQNKNQIYFPFFPFYSLSTFVQTNKDSKPTLKLTDVDKIVILLETADALKSLHDNNEYHNNISHNSILISSTKDAYLHNFYQNEKKIPQLTKPAPSYYYQTNGEAQYLLEHENGNLENYNMDNTEKKKKDIYSYGVLLYTIFSEKSPEVEINNLPRNVRLEKMSDYISFLLSENEEKNSENVNKKSENVNKESENEEKNSENVNKESENEEKNSENVNKKSENEEKTKINEIIKNCMNNSYDSFSKVIDSIKDLQIYKQNEEEIEQRIHLAPKSSEYECKLSDLVKCYLYGNQANLEYISKFLFIFNKFTKSKEDFNLDIRKDIINQIFNVFDIEPEQIPHEFDYLINSAIQKNVFENINNINIDINDPFLQLSLETNHQNLNEDESNNDLIIPVSSLSDFIEYNSSIYKKNQLYFIYSIAREISLIHSKNISINNLSTNKIGVYYNASENIFVPSIILFYSFFKRLNTQNIPKACQSTYVSDDDILKKQQKDIKKFHKIIQQNGDIFEKEFFIDNRQSLSINEIVNKLYDYIQKNEPVEKKQVILNSSFLNDYSSFNIDHPSLMKLFDMSFNFDHSFINLNKIFSTANKYIDELISDPNTPIKDLLNIESKLDNQQKQQDYYSMKSQFYSKCNSLYKKLNEEKPKDIEKVTKKEKKKYEHFSFKLYDLPEEKRKIRVEKITNMEKRDVFRYIEFSGLPKPSFNFIFIRYIKYLNPKCKYRIRIKLNYQFYKKTQDKPIKLEDIQYLLEKINPKFSKPFVQDSYIIVFIPRQI